jgi:DNA end-binding protein Ku
LPPVWSGTLTFGLVAIPVQVVSAVRSHKIRFHQIHRADHGRVRNRKTCELEMGDNAPALEPEEIGRAWETPDHRLVPVTDEELDQMPLPTARTVEISGFVDLSQIPGEQFGTPYFLTPQSAAANKPYALMREALARAGKGAVGKLAMRGSGETLAVVHPQGQVLVLQKLHWPDELRSADDARPRGDVELSEEEISAALAFISASGELDMSQMRDDYAAAMQELIEAKAKHEAPPRPAEPERPEGGVVDLMSALQASADQARGRRSHGEAEVHQMGERKPRKKATKKAPAKKATKRGGGKRAG